MTGGGRGWGRGHGKGLIKRGLWVFGWDEQDFQMRESRDLRRGRGRSGPGWSEMHFRSLGLPCAFMLRDPKCPTLVTIAQWKDGEREETVCIPFQ